MMVSSNSKIGNNEKWLLYIYTHTHTHTHTHTLYIILLEPMPFASDLYIVSNNNLDSERKKRISDDPSDFGPSI